MYIFLTSSEACGGSEAASWLFGALVFADVAFGDIGMPPIQTIVFAGRTFHR